MAMATGKAWTVRDRYGNEIYLTWERWEHIIAPDNHPEVEPYFDKIAETIRLGRRRQDKYDPNGYQYYNETKINYDQEADVLYVSFGQSKHVTGIELTDNVLLRLDTGKATGSAPRAIGLTLVSFARMMAAHKDAPVMVSLVDLRRLPEELWQAVLAVITTAPVSDYLSVNLSLSPQTPPLPELQAA